MQDRPGRFRSSRPAILVLLALASAGAVNDQEGYGFMIVATDAEVSGGGDTDGVRIKIWDLVTEEVLYDNQTGETLDSDETTALGGGSVVIHGG